MRGLSPRVRGNRQLVPVKWRRRRSIPARAGEPCPTSRSPSAIWVYPRACGGTALASMPIFNTDGLSPRVRGNPGPVQPGGDGAGSIPARAGEPAAARDQNHHRRVYPRACGGTSHRTERAPRRSGLSPRVRGNLLLPEGGGLVARSIPARAGEPPSRRTRPRERKVYPRACGGTIPAPEPLVPGMGLSPRVRGNHDGRVAANDLRGSIPARAGEPPSQSLMIRWARVYPRACGGTTSSANASLM